MAMASSLMRRRNSHLPGSESSEMSNTPGNVGQVLFDTVDRFVQMLGALAAGRQLEFDRRSARSVRHARRK